MLSPRGELVSVPGGIETGLGLERAWNPVTTPFRNVPQAQGQVIQGNLRGKRAWASHEYPPRHAHTPAHPTPTPAKVQRVCLALSGPNQLPWLPRLLSVEGYHASTFPRPHLPLLGPECPELGTLVRDTRRNP